MAYQAGNPWLRPKPVGVAAASWRRRLYWADIQTSLRSRSSKLADTRRTDELSYVRATLKHQLTNRYRYRTDGARSRNRALERYYPVNNWPDQLVNNKVKFEIV